MNQWCAGIVVSKDSPRSVEVGRLGQARPAQMIVATRGKLHPATEAERGANQGDPCQAARAEMDLSKGWQCRPADKTDRWEAKLLDGAPKIYYQVDHAQPVIALAFSPA